MATMSESDRQKFLEDTKGQAVALLEDLAHFREILSRPNPFRGDLRRISATLRRLLIERSITMVAGPRIGRLHFLIDDNKKMRFDLMVLYFGGGGHLGTPEGSSVEPFDIEKRRKNVKGPAR